MSGTGGHGVVKMETTVLEQKIKISLKKELVFK